MSILTKANPLATENWKLSNLMTSRALGRISENGGPGCCKRDSYLAIMEAVNFTRENFGIEMESSEIVCSRAHLNNHCLKGKCIFNR